MYQTRNLFFRSETLGPPPGAARAVRSWSTETWSSANRCASPLVAKSALSGFCNFLGLLGQGWAGGSEKDKHPDSSHLWRGQNLKADELVGRRTGSFTRRQKMFWIILSKWMCVCVKYCLAFLDAHGSTWISNLWRFVSPTTTWVPQGQRLWDHSSGPGPGARRAPLHGFERCSTRGFES